MDSRTIPSIILIVVFVVFSAYFSATETAFSTLNITRIKTLCEKGNRRAKKVLSLCDNYDKLLSAILIGNNIVNIAMSAVATVLFIKMCGQDAGATVATVVITVVVLVFGEISPKSMAKENPEKFAMFSAPFISFFIALFTPFNFLFGKWKKLLSKLTSGSQNKKTTQDELLQYVKDVESEGSIDRDEGTLLKNVIEFDDISAEDILTHRVDIEAVPIDAEKEKIAQVFSESKFSRLVVYDGNIDNIVGVIHQKDFYIGMSVTDKSIKEIISQPIFVPKSDKLDTLLRELQANKSHMAVVVDEYGGTLGIVTLEDVLEELVGEIWDEHDEVFEPIKKIDQNKYIIDCGEQLDNFFSLFKINSETDSNLIGGWVTEQLKKIPERSDSFVYENLKITVLEADSKRVKKIMVCVVK